MDRIKISEEIDHQRCRFFGTATKPTQLPAITPGTNTSFASHPDASSYASKFSGKYAHRTITGGVGHNLAQEAPQAFAEAVVDIAKS
jgi:hypothetical protein